MRYARRDSSDTKTKASAADFTTATSGRYTFPEKRACGWIKVGTSSNGVAQDDREFQLVLTGFYQHFHAPNGLGTTASLWVTIQDDDRLEIPPRTGICGRGWHGDLQGVPSGAGPPNEQDHPALGGPVRQEERSGHRGQGIQQRCGHTGECHHPR